jgi:hypothetical protein
MIMMTLNCQGLASPSKKLALKRLIEAIKSLHHSLQELMVDMEKTTQELSKKFTNWEFSYIDAIGRLRGEHYLVEEVFFYPF